MSATTPAIAQATGEQILDLARQHVGEHYTLRVGVPKDNANWNNWKGPWNCSEFVSWTAFQVVARKNLAGPRIRVNTHPLAVAVALPFSRLALLLLSRCFAWRRALVVVKPETLVGWHRKALQLFWRWKSRGGRPRVPGNLRALIAEMVRENPTWGQRRVASELALKLGIHISPRTIRAYWPEELEPSHRRGSEETTPRRWWPATLPWQ